jgi:two-component system sensor histidine kinase MtrB
MVQVDVRRIERIVRNLIVNAIDYGEGRPVEVRVASNANAAALTVRDHGIGLKPGEDVLVFTRFWRADPARSKTRGGSGLGLAIAVEDARLHGGKLQAWGHPQEGAVFRLTLPRRAGGDYAISPLPLGPATEPAEARSAPLASDVDAPSGRPR